MLNYRAVGILSFILMTGYSSVGRALDQNKVDIPQNHIYFGISLYGRGVVTPLEEKIQAKFYIINVSNDELKKIGGSLLNGLNILGRNYPIVMVTLHPGKISLTHTINGKSDVFYKVWADAIKEYGKPVFLRWNHEMNGDWYSYCVSASKRCVDPSTGIHQTPAEYVKAWRHVHKIFRDEGVTNVSWVWCPSAEPRYVNKDIFQAAYPGDAFVDWVCLDVYNNTLHRKWLSFDKVFDKPYSLLKSIAPDKPVMIGEFNSMRDRASDLRRAQWFSDAFTTFKKNRNHIKAVLLWQRDRRGNKNYPKRRRIDWNVEDDKATLRVVQKNLHSKTFDLRHEFQVKN